MILSFFDPQNVLAESLEHSVSITATVKGSNVTDVVAVSVVLGARMGTLAYLVKLVGLFLPFSCVLIMK